MSRAERERWLLAEERWPTLQQFVSTEMSGEILGDVKLLPKRFQDVVSTLELHRKQQLASELWDIRSQFGSRYDDVSLLRDGLGARGKLHGFTQDNGSQPGLKRMMLFYDALVESIRTEVKDWKP